MSNAAPSHQRVTRAAKGIISQVAGNADILVAPFGADAAGVVLGPPIPIIFTIRADGELTREDETAASRIGMRRYA